jgi:predicted unusual protein kinase regulating ubiquinone biosynthesis (AarF/ABC1/UbiB family)
MSCSSLSLSLPPFFYTPPLFALLKIAARILDFQEIDYTKEAANAELFASNFKNMDYVKVPSIFWEYTTPQV